MLVVDYVPVLILKRPRYLCYGWVYLLDRQRLAEKKNGSTGQQTVTHHHAMTEEFFIRPLIDFICRDV